MKQHITLEQLEQLDYNVYVKLVQKEYGSNVAYKYTKIENCKRMFNIGKMIEILERETTSLSIQNYNNTEPTWEVVIGFGMGGIEFFNKELVDALWEAVKEVLNA